MRKHRLLSSILTTPALVGCSQFRTLRSALLSLTLSLLLGASPALAHPGAHAVPPAKANTPAVATAGMDALGTARTFAAALAKGDATTATSLLAEDVVIYESGGQESSRTEYTSHHLQLDILFLAGLKVQVVDQKHAGAGDIAWVITRSRLTGSHKGKPVDLYSTETLVLKHSVQGWKIVHIHWSSQAASSKPE